MKIFSHKDLPEDRLSTTDELGHRVYLFPAAVDGVWRNRRTIIQVLLICFFLLAPWLSFNGHQLILLDIEHRRFALFGLTFWAHDIPIFFLVLLIGTVGLAFVTAIWGRVWCGWACPQTVFIDGVFRRIERLVVGNHLEQMKLAREKLSFRKILRLGVKWALFVLAGLIISHSFLAYFVGSDRLWPMIRSNPVDNPTAFLIMAAITFLIVFDFGWFREQFCIIMCPYGRIQSLLMDPNSLAVMYDPKRGEPRGKPSAASSVKNGDCVDCHRCINVCPTGIDIRRGVQLECIACTACVDACDDVMTKLNRPKGLIRYESHAGLEGHLRKMWNPRTVAYLFVIFLACIALAWIVTHRSPIDVTFIRGHDMPYEVMKEGELAGRVLNHFKLNIKNQEFAEGHAKIELIQDSEDVKLVLPFQTLTLQSGELQRHPVFVTFPVARTKGIGVSKVRVRITFESEGRSERTAVFEQELPLVGPF